MLTEWLTEYLSEEQPDRYWVSTDPNRRAPLPLAPFAMEFPKRLLVHSLALLFDANLVLFAKGKTNYILFGSASVNGAHLAKAYSQIGIGAFRLLGKRKLLACLKDPTFGDLEREKSVSMLLTSCGKSANYQTPITTCSLKARPKGVEAYTLDFHTLLR